MSLIVNIKSGYWPVYCTGPSKKIISVIYGNPYIYTVTPRYIEYSGGRIRHYTVYESMFFREFLVLLPVSSTLPL